MKVLCAILIAVLSPAATGRAEEVLFQDHFNGQLGEGWSWVRQHSEAWRVTEHGLEVRVEPGNMWGPQNDARNVLVRAAPEMKGEIEVAATVENHPTAQYEQVDLVWYYNDSYMVKLGLELVDGKLSIVMSREESDRTRTIKIIPTKETTVQLLLRVKGNQIHGRFRTPASNDWQDVGECDLPAPPEHRPKISLQFYQGPADAEHWARVTELRITLGGGKIHSALGRIRNESRSRQAIHRLGAIEQSMERRRSRRHAIDRWDRGTAVSRQDGAVVCLVLEQGRAARNQRGPR